MLEHPIQRLRTGTTLVGVEPSRSGGPGDYGYTVTGQLLGTDWLEHDAETNEHGTFVAVDNRITCSIDQPPYTTTYGPLPISVTDVQLASRSIFMEICHGERSYTEFWYRGTFYPESGRLENVILYRRFWRAGSRIMQRLRRGHPRRLLVGQARHHRHRSTTPSHSINSTRRTDAPPRPRTTWLRHRRDVSPGVSRPHTSSGLESILGRFASFRFGSGHGRS